MIQQTNHDIIELQMQQDVLNFIQQVQSVTGWNISHRRFYHHVTDLYHKKRCLGRVWDLDCQGPHESHSRANINRQCYNVIDHAGISQTDLCRKCLHREKTWMGKVTDPPDAWRIIAPYQKYVDRLSQEDPEMYPRRVIKDEVRLTKFQKYVQHTGQSVTPISGLRTKEVKEKSSTTLTSSQPMPKKRKNKSARKTKIVYTFNYLKRPRIPTPESVCPPSPATSVETNACASANPPVLAVSTKSTMEPSTKPTEEHSPAQTCTATLTSLRGATSSEQMSVRKDVIESSIEKQYTNNHAQIEEEWSWDTADKVQFLEHDLNLTVALKPDNPEGTEGKLFNIRGYEIGTYKDWVDDKDEIPDVFKNEDNAVLHPEFQYPLIEYKLLKKKKCYHHLNCDKLYREFTYHYDKEILQVSNEVVSVE